MLESRFVVYNHYEPPIDYTDDDEIRNVSDRDSDDDDVRRENDYNDGDNHFDRENYSNIHNNFDDFDDEEGEEEEDSRGSCSSRSRKSSQRYQATLDRRTRPHQKSHPSKTSMKFPLPTIDFRNLTFDRPIGQGGFSRVYRGRWNNDIMVAIKEPFYYSHNSISLINRAILEEARLHLHLNHPNIIKLYGISINAHRLYLIMEYAHGRSLRELLSQRSLTPNLIIKFAIQISSAMEYLHSLRPKPIIHRDLKSLNILLNRPITDDDWSYKQIKLTDLGLAREFSGSAQSMMTQCGTYAWMAPESITESKFSKASDVWSFGVVLWELLTGQIPYRNVSGAAVAFGIGNRKLTLPIPESCPDELKRILKSCWQQSPNQRPNFRTIRLDLEKSSFNVINKEKFEKMKRIWFEEIETIWKGLKLKEKELEFREYKARMKEAEAKEKEREIERMKKFLLKQSDELKRREIEVVGRELNVLLHQQQQQQQTNDNNKPIKGKRKREKRLITKKNFLQNNSDEVRGGDPVIGYPKNFCHNLTIRNASPETNQSQISLQAKALNQTWTPGTKIRPELNVNLFSNSQLNSRELQNEDNADDDVNNDDLDRSKNTKQKKKIAIFIRKIFKSSKLNLLIKDSSQQNRTNKATNSEKNRDNDSDSADDVHDDGEDDDDDDVEDAHSNLLVANRLKDRNKPLIFNRTYHGQTKYSERQQVNLLEHFRRNPNNPIRNCLHENYYHRNTAQPPPFDDDEMSSSDRQSYDCEEEDYRDKRFVVRKQSQSRQRTTSNSSTKNDYLIDGNIHHDRSTTINESERAFDADLLKEIDRFEHELKLMNSRKPIENFQKR